MYDFLVDLLQVIWRNGLSLYAGIGIVFVILRQRRFKKQIKKIIPWLFQDDSEVKNYVENQKRIESKLDLLLKERGLTWSAPISKRLEANTQTNSSRRFILLQRGLSIVQYVKKRMNLRRMNMQKFKSRKFWMAVVTAILVVLNDGLDLGVDSETVLAFAGIVATWIIGESAVDATRKKGDANRVDYSASDEVSE